MSSTPRIAFAGTPAFAVPALQAVLDFGAEVSLVLTQPDRPAGRGRKLAVSEVKRLARASGLTVRQPPSLQDADSLVTWGEPPDLLVVAAYGLILPEWLLEWPRLCAVNVHASLLPRWRGAAPIQRAILEGDETTGISIMRMTQGLDTGPVFASRSVRIEERDTAGTLHDRLATLGAELLIDTLPEILDATAEAAPQDERAASYAPKIAKDEAVLQWEKPAVELDRRVRAFNPWPICVASLSDGRTLRVHEAQQFSRPSAGSPGSIVRAARAGIDVATGDGVLRLLRVQPPGGRAMSVQAYLNAHALNGVSFVG